MSDLTVQLFTLRVHLFNIDPNAFSKKAGISPKPNRLRVVNVDGRNGLSSKKIIGESAHKAPKIIDDIDISNINVLKLKIKEYGKIIKDEPIENAIVILKNGTVKRCYGSLNGVWPNADLGDELKGGIVIHNHPIGSDNEYSFSNMDINLFVDYELEMLQGIDERYIYQMSRSDLTVDEAIPLIKFTEYDSRSETVRGRMIRMGYGYRRWKHEYR